MALVYFYRRAGFNAANVAFSFARNGVTMATLLVTFCLFLAMQDDLVNVLQLATSASGNAQSQSTAAKTKARDTSILNLFSGS